ncbi:hypothetical protein TTHERM_00492540 (macronuclear) [Tetrahymena thermophila SB210]|uniref:Uncharacterized protein n=1 Tax=Tetrahymena thermophila (strain SB210) TaxID=312017 RepID=I7M3C7_TETTS|nr:hypothetical protein TTHERM_00492540 [Tetrahymena thermophila SB210]EAS02901.2 hypothetical protein TTHERM_00492540 [Tetrahymena thermophila SB210]|eukprot:XP_001023146.2 hypothetical protein TTHERM_00492540 [Tetrahymena thermophila SB210]
MSQYRNQALKMSVQLDQLLEQVQEVRFGMYDMAEIPHLFNQNNLSIDDDLKTISEAQQYINDNVSVQLSEELSEGVSQNIQKLYQLKEQAAQIIINLQAVFQKMKNGEFEMKLQEKICNQLVLISNVLNI